MSGGFDDSLLSAARDQRALARELAHDWANLHALARAAREDRQRERARLHGPAAALLALTNGPAQDSGSNPRGQKGPVAREPRAVAPAAAASATTAATSSHP